VNSKLKKGPSSEEEELKEKYYQSASESGERNTSNQDIKTVPILSPYPTNRILPKPHLSTPYSMGYYGPYGPSAYQGYAPVIDNKLNQYEVGPQPFYAPNYNYSPRVPYYPLEMTGYNMPTTLRGPSPVMTPHKFQINRGPLAFPNMRGPSIDSSPYQGYYRNFPYSSSEIPPQRPSLTQKQYENPHQNNQNNNQIYYGGNPYGSFEDDPRLSLDSNRQKNPSYINFQAYNPYNSKGFVLLTNH
jgi:hypothetical protein